MRRTAVNESLATIQESLKAYKADYKESKIKLVWRGIQRDGKTDEDAQLIQFTQKSQQLAGKKPRTNHCFSPISEEI